MARIAIDVDDTLYSFATEARRVLAQRAVDRRDPIFQVAAYTPWYEWRTPPDLLGVEEWLSVIDEVHEDESILGQTPYPGSYEALWNLHTVGHDLVYISSRAPSTYEATQAWLFTMCDFPVADLVCTSHDKREALRTCQYLIDDRPFTLVNFVTDFHWKYKHGSDNEDMQRKAFGLLTEFNRALTDVTNVYLAPSWSLLHHYLTEKGLLPEVAHV